MDHHGDEEDPASSSDVDHRAQLACQLIGDHDYAQAHAAGRVESSPTGYRNACRSLATTTWFTDAHQAATANPDWSPEDIAQHLTASRRLPPPTEPHATAHAPDRDLRNIPVQQTDRGAAIVDLDTARARTAT